MELYFTVKSSYGNKKETTHGVVPIARVGGGNNSSFVISGVVFLLFN